jgi:raffinose/stachyose/melibiose transport system substrate-binding protein
MKGMLKSLAVAAGASALALPLAAVGTAGVASAQGSTVPLVLWEGSNLEAQNAPILKAFQAKTGIKISTLIFSPITGYSDTLTKWAAGTRPDLLQWFGIGNYVAVLNPTQTLVPLTNMPFVKETPASFLDNTVRYDGQIWAAMLDTPILDTVSYNKPIFTKLGLSAPNNFNQLVALCQTIKQKDPSVAPIAGGFGDLWPDQIPPFVMWNSYLQTNYAHIMAGINDNTVHFTDPQFVQGFQDLLTLQKDGCYNSTDLTQTWAQSVDSLMSGKAAMEFAVGPAATFPTYSVAQINSTEGIFTVSQTNNVGSWQGTSDGYYVPNTGSSQREAEAKEFINFITGPYYQTYINTQKEEPLLAGAHAPAGIPNVEVQAYHLFETNSVPQYQQDLKAAYSSIFPNWIAAMLAGKMTPLKVATLFQNSYDLGAKQIGLKGF